MKRKDCLTIQTLGCLSFELVLIFVLIQPDNISLHNVSYNKPVFTYRFSQYIFEDFKKLIWDVLPVEFGTPPKLKGIGILLSSIGLSGCV